MGGGDEVDSIDVDVESKIMPGHHGSGLEFWKEVFVRNRSSTYYE